MTRRSRIEGAVEAWRGCVELYDLFQLLPRPAKGFKEARLHTVGHIKGMRRLQGRVGHQCAWIRDIVVWWLVGYKISLLPRALA